MTNTDTICLPEIANRAKKSHCLADWLTAHGATAEQVASDSELRDSDLRDRVTARLRDELSRALSDVAHFSTEDDEPDPSTLGWMQDRLGSVYPLGSETVPGVWHDGSTYVAWDWDPTSPGEAIEVTEADLAAERTAETFAFAAKHQAAGIQDAWASRSAL